jgi:hypothetical protein
MFNGMLSYDIASILETRHELCETEGIIAMII